MGRALWMMAIAAGMAATVSAMARQGPDGAVRHGSRRETVPLQVKDEQVADMQRKLNDQGFSAGEVDGLWGPNTSAALRRYQAKNGLRQTGQLDQGTLAALGAASAMAVPPASMTQAAAVPAQLVPAPAPPASVPTPPASAPQPSPPIVAATPGAPVPAAPGVDTSTGTSRAAGLADRNTDVAAAAGDRNQAVATTAANAPQPARGSNSFSRGEARRRIERAGFAAVADLQKDTDGVWRGHGTKDGASVGVWLDYKGNVGQR